MNVRAVKVLINLQAKKKALQKVNLIQEKSKLLSQTKMIQTLSHCFKSNLKMPRKNTLKNLLKNLCKVIVLFCLQINLKKM